MLGESESILTEARSVCLVPSAAVSDMMYDLILVLTREANETRCEYKCERESGKFQSGITIW